MGDKADRDGAGDSDGVVNVLIRVAAEVVQTEAVAPVLQKRS